MIWVERLNGCAFLRILLNTTLRNHREVRYRAISDRVLRYLPLLKKWNIFHFEFGEFEVALGDMNSDDDRSAFCDYIKHLRCITKNITNYLWIDEDYNKHLWYNKESLDRVRLYLENTALEEINFHIQLATYVLHVAHSLKASHESVLIINPSPWSGHIRKFYRERGLSVISNWQLQKFKNIRYIYRSYRTILNNINRQEDHISNDHSCSSSKKPSLISTLYIRGTSNKDVNDLFWYHGSGINANNVLVSFEYPAFKVTPAELKSLRDSGINFIMINRDASIEQVDDVWNPSRKIFEYNYRSMRHFTSILARSVVKKHGMWRLRHLMDLLLRVDWWEDFFNQNNIKIDFRITFYNIAQSIAMDNTGGISVSAQWSIWLEFWSFNPATPISSHVYFIWGPIFESFSLDSVKSPDVQLISGYSYDRYIPSKKKLDEIGHQLKRNGAKFNVVIFDERILEEHFNIRLAIKFFSAFMNLSLRNPDYGLIIKPKSTRKEIIKSLIDIQPLLFKAFETGRVVMLDADNKAVENKSISHNNQVSSLRALSNADLTVNFVSTTGMEAELSGVPSLYYDFSNLLRSDITKLQSSNNDNLRFVFNNIDSLIEAVERHKNIYYNKGGLRRPTYFNEKIELLDPFRDGKAGNRVGSYLKWLLEGFERGEDRETIMADATEKYMKRWGEDKVTTFS